MLLKTFRLFFSLVFEYVPDHEFYNSELKFSHKRIQKRYKSTQISDTIYINYCNNSCNTAIGFFMNVNLKNIIELSNQLLNKVIECGFEEVELENDWYWEIFCEDREDLSKKNKTGIGSIYDDLEALNKILNKKNIGGGLIINVEKFANIIIAVQEAILRPKKNIDMN